MDTDTVFDYLSETYQLPDGSYVNCEIMDTGGQEEFDAQNRLYYKRADCCLLVYDITNPNSFKAIKNHYVKEIKDNCKENITVILLGNKTDLEKKRKITKKEGASLAEKNKYIFMETSCEQNFNVQDAFETLIIMTNTEMVKNQQLNLNEKSQIRPFKLDDEKTNEENEENNESLKIKDNELNKDIKKGINKKKKKKCCLIF